jgi:ribosome-associated protein
MRQEVLESLEREVKYRYSRSSGPGGQNVNKVNSKVTLCWHLESSSALSVSQKKRFQEKFHNQISESGLFQLSVDETRDQPRNRDIAFKRLLKLISSISLAPKRRVKTKPSKRAVQRRLDEKRATKDRKSNRKKDWR